MQAGSLGRLEAAVRRGTDVISGQIATRRAAILLFALSLVVYAIEALAWPMARGRDTWDYLAYYLELPHGHPLFPELMLYRTPVASLVVGGSMQVGGDYLLEIVMGLLYAGSIVAYALAASRFGRLPALLVPVVILAYPGYATVFHSATSDGVFAACFALWVLLLVRAVELPTALRFGMLGIGVALLALTRPVGQAFLVTAVVALFMALSWRMRLRLATACVATALVILGAWAVHNGLRYGDYVVSRSGREVGSSSIAVPQQPVVAAGERSVGDKAEHLWRAAWSMLTVRAIREPGVRQPQRVPPPGSTVGDQPGATPEASRLFALNVRSGFLYCRSDFIDRCTVDPTSVWGDREQQARYRSVVKQVKMWNTDLPSRNGSVFVADQLKRVAWKFPRAPFWLLLFVIGILLRRPQGSLVLIAVCLGALVVAGLHAYLQQPIQDYVLPVYPAFIFVGIAAVSGNVRRSRREPLVH